MPNVAELITEHVTLTVDCVDRLYLNAYVPRLKRGLSNFAYLRTLGQRINTRLLQAERVALDCGLGEPQLTALILPSRTPDGQPAPGLKFGQPRVAPRCPMDRQGVTYVANSHHYYSDTLLDLSIAA